MKLSDIHAVQTLLAERLELLELVKRLGDIPAGSCFLELGANMITGPLRGVSITGSTTICLGVRTEIIAETIHAMRMSIHSAIRVNAEEMTKLGVEVDHSPP